MGGIVKRSLAMADFEYPSRRAEGDPIAKSFGLDAATRRAEKSGWELGVPLILGQMSRLRFAPLDMTRASARPQYLGT
jgi:hypothetical protein